MEDKRNIQPAEIEYVMKEAYVDYAMSVIVSRALPDARDGLKPVHRRILYTMFEEHITPDKKFRKSAATVGNVIARYHPHGDAAVYDAMVRMAQPFNMRYPLVWPQGNFGSIDGDSPAHMRYTEAKLAQIAMSTLADINKDTVDWRPNFDNSTQEPIVLPTVLPNLLVNGSDGIAVGMATKIPPHNLGEVVDATVALIDNEDIAIEELMTHIKGPDFPTGAKILGTRGIRDAYMTGKGSITMRAVMEVEEIRHGKHAIVVTEIPYQVNKSRLIEKIAEAVKAKRIEGVTDLRDESSRKGMRIVLELRNDAIPDVVMNQLYKHSDMQCNFGAIMLALVDDAPKLLNLKEMLECFVGHRRDVVTRRTKFELEKALARDHIVIGLLKALDHIDEIIALIKASPDPDTARAALMERFELSERQAQAILDMRLQRLTGLEREKLEEEHRTLVERIAYLEGLLADKLKMNEVIRQELVELKAKFGDERRTQIVPFAGDIDLESLIPDEPAVVTMSHSGYIKRVPVGEYKVQRRGGKGVSGTDLKEGDFLEHFFVTRTHNYLLFFTNKGRVFRLKVYELPEFGRNAKGTPVINMLRLAEGETVASVIPMDKASRGGCIITATRRGLVKRTALRLFANLRAAGLNALKLDDDDELVSVAYSAFGAGEAELCDDLSSDNAEEGLEGVSDEELSDEPEEEPEEIFADSDDEQASSDEDSLEDLPSDDDGSGIIIVTRNGNVVRFREDKVRLMGRSARGVRGIKLREGDEVVAMDIGAHGSRLLIVTENGFGKRTLVKRFASKGRAIYGVIGIRITPERGRVAAASVVEPEYELMISSRNGLLIRTNLDEIRDMGRAASGVRFIKLAEGDSVSGMVRIIPEDLLTDAVSNLTLQRQEAPEEVNSDMDYDPEEPDQEDSEE